MDVLLLDEIRDHYKFLTPEILNMSEDKGAFKWCSPYCSIDWVRLFSPIEKQAWEAIRIFGHAPFYPQYPVNNFFVDFGNPYLKIAIECDGEEFHKDKEKDEKRDQELLDAGWIVFRISGSDCCKLVNADYYNMRGDKYVRGKLYKEFYENTIEGLLKSIAAKYFNYTEYSHEEEYEFIKQCLNKRISIRPPWWN